MEYSRSNFVKSWRLVLLLSMSLALTACEIPRFTFNDPASPLMRAEFIGVWFSEEGDSVLEFSFDGTMTFHSIAGDVWDWHDGSSTQVVEGRGTWELCASKYPRTKLICGNNVPGRVDAMRIGIDVVSIDGEEESLSLRDRGFAITGDVGERVVWLHPDDYYNSDPRTKFTKQ